MALTSSTTVPGESDSIVLSALTFSDLGLNTDLVKKCADISMPHPTAIQYHCIPEILKGIRNYLKWLFFGKCVFSYSRVSYFCSQFY